MFAPLLLVASTCINRGIPSTACELEEKGHCDFAKDKQTCYFADRFEEDIGVPVNELLNGIITRKKRNKGCRMPKPGERPFVVQIEPCFNNGTLSSTTDIDHCEDPSAEFYTKHLFRVGGIPADGTTYKKANVNKDKEDTAFKQKSNHFSPHIVSGIPSEVRIIKIGKKLVLGNKPDPRGGENPELRGQLLSRFQFRTLPMHKMAYDKYLEAAKTTFKAFMGDPVKRNTDEADTDSEDQPADREMRDDYHPSTAPEGWAQIEWEHHNDDPSGTKTHESAWIPKVAYSCPLQITFDDTREPTMSASQQMENIIAVNIDRITDIPLNLEKSGVGCYMCITPRDGTLKETLMAEGNWNRHFHEYCTIKGGRMVPYMRSSDMAKKADYQFRPDHLDVDVHAGIYTLYPYTEQAAPAYKEVKPTLKRDEYHFMKLSESIANYMDPAYAITVEITGMKKNRGKRVMRNFHGRLLEKGLVNPEYRFFKHPGTPVYHVKTHDRDFIDQINKAPFAWWMEGGLTDIQSSGGETTYQKLDFGLRITATVPSGNTPRVVTPTGTTACLDALRNYGYNITKDQEESLCFRNPFFEQLGAYARELPIYKRDQWGDIFDLEYTTKNYEETWHNIDDDDFSHELWPEIVSHPSSQLCNVRRRAICINGRLTPLKRAEGYKYGEYRTKIRPWSTELTLDDIDLGNYTGMDYLPIELSGAILNPLCLMAFQSCRHTPLDDDDQMFVMTFWDYMRWSDLVTEYFFTTTRSGKDGKGFMGDSNDDLTEYDPEINIFYRNRPQTTHFSCYFSKFDLVLPISPYYLYGVQRGDDWWRGHPCSICDNFEEMLKMIEFEDGAYNETAKANNLWKEDQRHPFWFNLTNVIQTELTRQDGTGMNYLSVHCTVYDGNYKYKINQPHETSLFTGPLQGTDSLIFNKWMDDFDSTGFGLTRTTPPTGPLKQAGHEAIPNVPATPWQNAHSECVVTEGSETFKCDMFAFSERKSTYPNYDVMQQGFHWPDYGRDDDILFQPYTSMDKRQYYTHYWYPLVAPPKSGQECEDSKRDKDVPVADPRKKHGVYASSNDGCSLVSIYIKRIGLFQAVEYDGATDDDMTWVDSFRPARKKNRDITRFAVHEMIADMKHFKTSLENVRMDSAEKMVYEYIVPHDHLRSTWKRDANLQKAYGGFTVGSIDPMVKFTANLPGVEPSNTILTGQELLTVFANVFDQDEVANLVASQQSTPSFQIMNDKIYDSIRTGARIKSDDLPHPACATLGDCGTYYSPIGIMYRVFTGQKPPSGTDADPWPDPLHSNWQKFVDALRAKTRKKYAGHFKQLRHKASVTTAPGLFAMMSKFYAGQLNYETWSALFSTNAIMKKPESYVRHVLAMNRLRGFHLYLTQQATSWEPAEKASCIVGQIFEKEIDGSGNYMCQADVDEIKNVGGTKLRVRNISVSFDNMYPIEGHLAADHYFVYGNKDATDPTLGADVKDSDDKLYEHCELDTKLPLMSGLFFDTNYQNNQEKDGEKYKDCPRVQHHNLWTLAVFFGDSKFVWGQKARRYLSNVAQVPGLGCTMEPGIIEYKAVWGTQCHSLIGMYVPKKVETKVSTITFTSCMSKELVAWWNELFSRQCRYDNVGFITHAMCFYGKRKTCSEFGNTDGCGPTGDRGKAYRWANWEYKEGAGWFNDTLDKLEIKKPFMDFYKETYNTGREFLDVLYQRTQSAMMPQYYWRKKRTWDGTFKGYWEYPWKCLACQKYDQISDEYVGINPFTYSQACDGNSGWYGQFDVGAFGPSLPGDMPDGTDLPEMNLIQEETECAYEHTIRGYFVDHAQCPNSEALKHFIDTEKYADYYTCSCFIVDELHNTNAEGDRRCCTPQEAEDLQAGVLPYTQVLYEKNSEDVDGIFIWSFTSDEYNYVGTPLKDKDDEENKHHCPLGQDEKLIEKNKEKFVKFNEALSLSYSTKNADQTYHQYNMCPHAYPIAYTDPHGESRCCATMVTRTSEGRELCAGDLTAGILGKEVTECPLGYFTPFINATWLVGTEFLNATSETVLRIYGITTENAQENHTLILKKSFSIAEEAELTKYKKRITNNLEEIQDMLELNVGVPDHDLDQNLKNSTNDWIQRAQYVKMHDGFEAYSWSSCPYTVYPQPDPSLEGGCNPIKLLGVPDEDSDLNPSYSKLETFMEQFGIKDMLLEHQEHGELYTPYEPDDVDSNPKCYVYITKKGYSPQPNCRLGRDSSYSVVVLFGTANLVGVYRMQKISAHHCNVEHINLAEQGCGDLHYYTKWTSKIPNIEHIRFVESMHDGSDHACMAGKYRVSDKSPNQFFEPIRYSQRCFGLVCKNHDAALIENQNCVEQNQSTTYAHEDMENYAYCKEELGMEEMCSAISRRIITNIANEANIMGITIVSPILADLPAEQFPNGLVITTPHKKIHTRLNRALGPGSVLKRGCNVALVHSPNITFTNIELDNTDCQEEALMQLGNPDPEMKSTEDTFRNAFFKLKGWNMSPVHITNSKSDRDPTNISFSDVKLSSATNFRKMFPGRPLISVDSAGAPSGKTVNVSGLWLSRINDTHRYRDNRDDIDNPFPLSPLHVVMWNYVGNVTYHVSHSPILTHAAPL